MKRLLRYPAAVAAMLAAAWILSACGAAAASTSGAVPVSVSVTLTEFKIESSVTSFKTGVPYHFIVSNKGTTNHEFRILPPTSGQVAAAELDKMTLARIPDSALPAGATATLDYTFTQPAAAGALEFACHLPGHYEAGMHLPISVTGS